MYEGKLWNEAFIGEIGALELSLFSPKKSNYVVVSSDLQFKGPFESAVYVQQNCFRYGSEIKSATSTNRMRSIPNRSLKFLQYIWVYTRRYKKQ